MKKPKLATDEREVKLEQPFRLRRFESILLGNGDKIVTQRRVQM